MGIAALLMAASLGITSCGMAESGTQAKKKETEKAATEKTAVTESKAEGLIEEGGDIFVGPETESEEDLVVFNETEAETETEKIMAAQEMAGSVQETEAQTESETETEMETEVNNGPIGEVVSKYISNREALGETWSIAYEDLSDGTMYGYHEDDVLQSASVVKLFIMGAVYHYMCYPPNGTAPIEFHEQYDGELRDTIVSMITVSDNGCANLLIERLGEGDFAKGAERIGEFCKENGYVGTSIGRRFLEENPTGDNYTTAADTRKILSDMYHGTLVNEQASAKMLEIVKGQTRKNKIPAGLPAGFTSGNKTGEMPEGYGLGCIENDCAIVFPPEGEGEGYILTIMSTNLGGRNSEAISVIGQISADVAQWYLADRAQKTEQTETETAAQAVEAQIVQPSSETNQQPAMDVAGKAKSDNGDQPVSETTAQ